ncbi:hypothetical protein TNCV_1269541 [Trichonephila clavipes]|nr:hypothetical protein TNCV_1269541 [Trichonephila clavipes]
MNSNIAGALISVIAAEYMLFRIQYYPAELPGNSTHLSLARSCGSRKLAQSDALETVSGIVVQTCQSSFADVVITSYQTGLTYFERLAHESRHISAAVNSDYVTFSRVYGNIGNRVSNMSTSPRRTSRKNQRRLTRTIKRYMRSVFRIAADLLLGHSHVTSVRIIQ